MHYDESETPHNCSPDQGGPGSHGWYCGLKTVPTRCKHCRKRIYYMFCNCGCRFFVAMLGRPWPEHGCYSF